MNEQTVPVRGPFTKSRTTTQTMMLLVVISLMPAFGYGIYHFGMQAAVVCGIAAGCAMVSGILTDLIFKRRISLFDFSELVTGLLIGLSLPVNLPLWVPAAAAFVSVVLIRGLLGTLARIRIHPVPVVRLALWAAFPLLMHPSEDMALAEPLTVFKLTLAESGDLTQALSAVDVPAMIFGSVPGAIGATSMIALAVGAAFLILTDVIDLRIPGTLTISFVFVLLLFATDRSPAYITMQLAGGMFMLSAFFLATDPLSSPVTPWGRVLYGVLIGIICAALRILQVEEACMIAILAGNLFVPLIERVSVPRPFGVRNEAVIRKKAKPEEAPEEEEEAPEEEEDEEDEETADAQ